MLKKSMFLSGVEVAVVWLMLLSLTWGVAVCYGEETGSGYKIGNRDLLLLSVAAGGEEQINAELVVNDKGDINVPFLGKTRAAGRSVTRLESDIKASLAADYFVNPQVHIRVAEYHSLQFFISGAVKKPGMYELDFTPRVMDLIAKAEGVLPERGNIAYILHGVKAKEHTVDVLSGKIKPAVDNAPDSPSRGPDKVDLLKLLDEGDMSANIKLASGDTLYIPRGKKLNQTRTNIYVEGEVKEPGVFDFQPGLTVGCRIYLYSMITDS